MMNLTKNDLDQDKVESGVYRTLMTGFMGEINDDWDIAKQEKITFQGKPVGNLARFSKNAALK